MRFDGFRKVLPALSKGDDDQPLPDVKQGSTLELGQLLPSQHYTKPPARYTEAKLVQELEKEDWPSFDIRCYYSHYSR